MRAFFLQAARGTDHALTMEELRAALLVKGASKAILDANGGKCFKILYDTCPKDENGKIGYRGFANTFDGVMNRQNDERASLPQCSVPSTMMSPRAQKLYDHLQKSQEKLRNIGAERLVKEIQAKVQHKALTRAMGSSADVNPDVLKLLLNRHAVNKYLSKSAFVSAMNDKTGLDLCATRNDLFQVFDLWSKGSDKGVRVDDFVHLACGLGIKNMKTFYSGHKVTDKGDARAAKAKGIERTLGIIKQTCAEVFSRKRLGPLTQKNFQRVWSRWTGNYNVNEGDVSHADFTNVIRQDLHLGLDAIHPGDLHSIIKQFDSDKQGRSYGSFPLAKIMQALKIKGVVENQPGLADKGVEVEKAGKENTVKSLEGGSAAQPDSLSESIRRKVIYSGMMLPDFWKLVNLSRAPRLTYHMFHSAMLNLGVQPTDKHSTKALFKLTDRGEKGYISFDDFAAAFHPSGKRRSFPAKLSPDAKPWEKPSSEPYRHGLKANVDEAGGNSKVWSVGHNRLKEIIRMKAERKALSTSMGNAGVPNPSVLKLLLLTFDSNKDNILSFKEFKSAMRTSRGLDVKSVTDEDLRLAIVDCGGSVENGISIETFCEQVLPRDCKYAGKAAITVLMTNNAANERARGAEGYKLHPPPYDFSKERFSSNNWKSVAQSTIDESGQKAYKLPQSFYRRKRAPQAIGSLSEIASNDETRQRSNEAFPSSESSKLGAGNVVLEATKNYYSPNGGGLHAKRAMSLNATERPKTTRFHRRSLMKNILHEADEPIMSNCQATHGIYGTGSLPRPAMVKQKSYYTSTTYPEGPLAMVSKKKKKKKKDSLYNVYGATKQNPKIPSRPSTGYSKSSIRTFTPRMLSVETPESKRPTATKSSETRHAETQTNTSQPAPSSNLVILDQWRKKRAKDKSRKRAQTSVGRQRGRGGFNTIINAKYRNFQPTKEQMRNRLEVQRQNMLIATKQRIKNITGRT